MLETKIEELTRAVEALTKAIGGMQAPGSVTLEANTQPVIANVEREPVRNIPKTEIDDLPNEQPKTTTGTSQTSAEESKPVAYSDVSKLVTQIAKTDLAKAKAALSRLGVKHGKELTEAQWPEAVAYLTRVANGLDPETSHE